MEEIKITDTEWETLIFFARYLHVFCKSFRCKVCPFRYDKGCVLNYKFVRDWFHMNGELNND